MKFDFKSVLPHLIAVVFLAAFSAMYFYPQIQGEVIGSTDNLGWQGMAQEYNEHLADKDEITHWTTSMFGGMPTYQLTNQTSGNYLARINKWMQLGVRFPIGMFFAASLCFYLMMLSFRVRPILAVIGGLAFAYATFGLILYTEGHSNKYRAVAYLPLIIAGISLAFRKKYLLGGLLFALGMGLTLVNNHIQMTFYFGLTIGFYGLARLLYDWREGQLVHFAKAAAVLVLGLIIAVGSSAVNLLTTSEYVQETVRGQRYLSTQDDGQGGPSEGNGEGGFGWERAMGWSNGTKDVLASFVPMAAGGGRTYVDESTPWGSLMRRYQVPPNRDGEYQAPIYHGDMTFTIGPKYFGAVILVLFMLGVLLIKGPLRWWMVGGSVLIILISMGKNAAWFNRPLFDYLPYYNKFRAPDSAMAISVLLLATLGMLGLKKWLDLRRSDADASRRTLFIATASVAGFGLLVSLLGPMLLNFSDPDDMQVVSQILGAQANDQGILNSFLNAIEDTRIQLLRWDAFRVAFFALLAGGILYALWKKWVPEWAAIIGVGLLVVLDYHGINTRYHDYDDYQPNREIDDYFNLTAADRQLLADPDIHYRVYNTAPPGGDPFAESRTSYHHKSIGGYNAAKLRRYDDLIKRQLRQGNQAAYDMLNTKYFLVEGANGQMEPRRNPGALGNAWFVENIEYVDSHDAEMAALDDFNPDSTAIVKRDEFADQLAGIQLSDNGRIQLTSYEPNYLTYTSQNSGEGLAVFSETWYGPDLGWYATIDGEPAELIRVNYILRALRVPAGNHEIVMEFRPQSFITGRLISLICSWLIILGLIGYAVYWFLQQREKPNTAVPTEAIAEDTVSRPVATTRTAKKKTSAKKSTNGKKKRKKK